MRKTLLVAWREFASTALTKSFIIGALMTPVMILVVLGAVVLMKNLKEPQIVGEVALIDRTGLVAPGVVERFAPEAVEAERRRQADQAVQQVESSPAGAVLDAPGAPDPEQLRVEIESHLPKENLSLTVLPPDADPDAEKRPLEQARIRTARSDDGSQPASRLALVVITPESVIPPEPGKYGKFQAFFASELDFQIQDRIKDRVRDAIVEARLAHDPRLQSAGISPDDALALVRRPEAESRTIDESGQEQQALGELRMFIPMAFMILMMIAVMTGGQYLLTTTVEEKSSRVMEVLLSAVSPMQLLTGKVIGQLCVGLVIVLLYGGLGLASLLFFALANLISILDLVYLIVFFIIAYFIVAAMMAAIGSAVNDMREAQSLMGPVMVVLMFPWLIWFVIQRAPNSTLATVLSFVPAVNPFVMVIRLGGSEPVDLWQILLSIAVGIATAVFMCWAAAKIFRIGVLMYGKPPNLATLIRWVRMA